MFATVPNPVVYEQTIFTVKVHCAPAAPKRCAGVVTLRFKGKVLGEAPYRVARGMTGKAVLDGATPVKVTTKDRTIEVSIDGGDYVKRRLVIGHSNAGGGEEHSDYPITHVVKDRRGDGVGALDLRRAEAHVRNRRLIITWTCWRAFTPAQMSHDAGGFDANVYTRKPHTAGATRQHASVFYGAHGPVLFAGSEQGPNDWGGRFSRPTSRSVQMSIPLSRYGRHVRQLWIEPATYATTNLHYDMTESTIHFRTGG